MKHDSSCIAQMLFDLRIGSSHWKGLGYYIVLEGGRRHESTSSEECFAHREHFKFRREYVRVDDRSS
jgi:hypothetical protein